MLGILLTYCPWKEDSILTEKWGTVAVNGRLNFKVEIFSIGLNLFNFWIQVAGVGAIFLIFKNKVQLSIQGCLPAISSLASWVVFTSLFNLLTLEMLLTSCPWREVSIMIERDMLFDLLPLKGRFGNEKWGSLAMNEGYICVFNIIFKTRSGDGARMKCDNFTKANPSLPSINCVIDWKKILASFFCCY